MPGSSSSSNGGGGGGRGQQRPVTASTTVSTSVSDGDHAMTSSHACQQGGAGERKAGVGRHASSMAAAGTDTSTCDSFARRSILYTGPEGLRPHRVSVLDGTFTGEGYLSQEVSSQTDYLFRAPPDVKFPLAKNGRIGETGWNYKYFTGHDPYEQGRNPYQQTS